LNWRKPVILSLLRVSGSGVPGELSLIREIERSAERIAETQRARLLGLLRHAWAQVPYYHDVLESCGAVRDGRVDLDRFPDIPFLTKDIIRAEGDRLRAKALPRGRKAFSNASGGSTGEPVRFWQDSGYWDTTIAVRTYHFSTVGKQLGEREMKIWGNERDLFEGTLGWKATLQNWAYNRRFEQCWHLPETQILKILRDIDRWKPSLLWCYRDGIDAVAKYVVEHGLRPHTPAAVVLGGATVYPYMVEVIEGAFRAPAISAYGSREVGAVACQCLERAGHHIATHANVVETIDAAGRTVVGQDGELVITPLSNYAMPFLRYRIGDRGKLTDGRCPCGRGFPLLESLSGRMVEVLLNAKGEQVDPIYFIQLLAVIFNRGFVRKFQVMQDEDGALTLNVVLETGVTREAAQPNLDVVVDKIRLVMGAGFPIEIRFVDDIPLSASGKFPYVVRRGSLHPRAPA
jgi:phenylacetate-CoA ligase